MLCKSVAVRKCVQVGLFLRDFFSFDFDLMQLENLHHFSNLHRSLQFNAIWCRLYVIIFGLTLCSIYDPWSLLCYVGG